MRRRLKDTSPSSASPEREKLEEKFSAELIGQFDIVLLSSFLVAKKADALTRRIDSEQEFLYSNSGSSECIPRYDVERPELGSTVFSFQGKKIVALPFDNFPASLLKARNGIPICPDPAG